MTQLSASSMPRISGPVNVASVPQLSPFRYPGGKTWLIPWIRRWFQSMNRKPATLIEPFAGGGIVSLTSVFEGFVRRAIMVELDDDVAAVWLTILNGEAEWLARKISDFEISEESVRHILNVQPASTREKAFQTILKNRTYHGGILASGSGLIKKGEAGKGLNSRWYPETLKRRIRNINLRHSQIKFMHADGLRIIKAYIEREDAVFFVDPPYTAAGKKAGRRLYKHHALDHRFLFDLLSNSRGDFLVTYDLSDDIAQLALDHGFDIEPIPMMNKHHTQMNELLIGRNLDWARD